MGGEWVKRPKGAKGCENFGGRLRGLIVAVLIAGLGPQRINPKFVAGCKSRSGS
jgi:hypothetical protein